MKHIRPDQTFVYYYVRRADGQFQGLRFSRTDVMPVCGPETNPEHVQSAGAPALLPLAAEDMPQSIHEALGLVVDEHPEVSRLLRGELTFEHVLGTQI